VAEPQIEIRNVRFTHRVLGGRDKSFYTLEYRVTKSDGTVFTHPEDGRDWIPQDVRASTQAELERQLLDICRRLGAAAGGSLSAAEHAAVRAAVAAGRTLEEVLAELARGRGPGAIDEADAERFYNRARGEHAATEIEGKVLRLGTTRS